MGTRLKSIGVKEAIAIVVLRIHDLSRVPPDRNQSLLVASVVKYWTTDAQAETQ